jgi:O-methyltransferase involved in polyketide biosynthesis
MQAAHCHSTAQQSTAAAAWLCYAGVVNFVDARTKWFDQHVQEAVTQHGIRQVVVVAAGFDTRSYRCAVIPSEQGIGCRPFLKWIISDHQ